MVCEHGAWLLGAPSRQVSMGTRIATSEMSISCGVRYIIFDVLIRWSSFACEDKQNHTERVNRCPYFLSSTISGVTVLAGLPLSDGRACLTHCHSIGYPVKS